MSLGVVYPWLMRRRFQFIFGGYVLHFSHDFCKDWVLLCVFVSAFLAKAEKHFEQMRFILIKNIYFYVIFLLGSQCVACYKLNMHSITYHTNHMLLSNISLKWRGEFSHYICCFIVENNVERWNYIIFQKKIQNEATF